jgi:hypothetical protein
MHNVVSVKLWMQNANNKEKWESVTKENKKFLEDCSSVVLDIKRGETQTNTASPICIHSMQFVKSTCQMIDSSANLSWLTLTADICCWFFKNHICLNYYDFQETLKRFVTHNTILQLCTY